MMHIYYNTKWEKSKGVRGENYREGIICGLEGVVNMII